MKTEEIDNFNDCFDAKQLSIKHLSLLYPAIFEASGNSTASQDDFINSLTLKLSAFCMELTFADWDGNLFSTVASFWLKMFSQPAYHSLVELKRSFLKSVIEKMNMGTSAGQFEDAIDGMHPPAMATGDLNTLAVASTPTSYGSAQGSLASLELSGLRQPEKTVQGISLSLLNTEDKPSSPEVSETSNTEGRGAIVKSEVMDLEYETVMTEYAVSNASIQQEKQPTDENEVPKDNTDLISFGADEDAASVVSEAMSMEALEEPVDLELDVKDCGDKENVDNIDAQDTSTVSDDQLDLKEAEEADEDEDSPFYCCSCESVHSWFENTCYTCLVDSNKCEYSYTSCHNDAIKEHQQECHPGLNCSSVEEKRKTPISSPKASSDAESDFFTINVLRDYVARLDPGTVTRSAPVSVCPYKCQHCEFVCGSKLELNDHIAQDHADVSPSLCDDCGKVLGVKHETAHSCGWRGCEFKTCSTSVLAIHKKISAHKNGKEKPQNNLERGEDNSNDDDERAMKELEEKGIPFVHGPRNVKIYQPTALVMKQGKYECPACQVLCGGKRKSLLRHVKTEHNGNLYQVEIDASLFGCVHCSRLSADHICHWSCNCGKAVEEFCLINLYIQHLRKFHRSIIQVAKGLYIHCCPFCSSEVPGADARALLPHLHSHGDSCLVCKRSLSASHTYGQAYMEFCDTAYIICSNSSTPVHEIRKKVYAKKTQGYISNRFSDFVVTMPSSRGRPRKLQSQEEIASLHCSYEEQKEQEESEDDQAARLTTAFFQIDVEGLYRCYFCPYASALSDEMNTHIDEHHINLHRYSCRLCSTFKACRRAAWSRHMISEHGVCTHMLGEGSTSHAEQIRELSTKVVKLACTQCAAGSAGVRERKRRASDINSSGYKRFAHDWEQTDITGGLKGSRESEDETDADDDYDIPEDQNDTEYKEEMVSESSDCSEYEKSDSDDSRDEDYTPVADKMSKRTLPFSRVRGRPPSSIKDQSQHKTLVPGSSSGYYLKTNDSVENLTVSQQRSTHAKPITISPKVLVVSTVSSSINSGYKFGLAQSMSKTLTIVSSRQTRLLVNPAILQTSAMLGERKPVIEKPRQILFKKANGQCILLPDTLEGKSSSPSKRLLLPAKNNIKSIAPSPTTNVRSILTPQLKIVSNSNGPAQVSIVRAQNPSTVPTLQCIAKNPLATTLAPKKQQTAIAPGQANSGGPSKFAVRCKMCNELMRGENPGNLITNHRRVCPKL